MATFNISGNKLVISLDPDDLETIFDGRESGRSDDHIFQDVVESVICNSSWEFIAPEKIGAMTESFLLSESAEYDDNGNITKIGDTYYNNFYTLCTEIDDLLDTGQVVFWLIR